MSTTTLLRTIATSTVLAVALTATPLVGTVSAKNNKSNGNNGTLKVHEQGTPERTESNDPKVCVFNFEGYGFDKGQSGIIAISKQGGGKDRSIVKLVNMPAADANGYTETEYVTIDNGHYKTTLYGKDVHGDVDYNQELKAKSKVIKVACDEEKPATPTEPATPVTPVNPEIPAVPVTPVEPETPVDTDEPQAGGVGGDQDNSTPEATDDKGRVLADTDVKGTSTELPATVAATGNTGGILGLVLTALAGTATYATLLRRR